MNAIGRATEDDESAAAHQYFAAIERAFVHLRGAPLLLSPTDWQQARSWRAMGIPLELVLSALEEVFAHRRERAAKGRVSSLRYCAPAIEAAWLDRQELLAPGLRASDRAVAEPGGDEAGMADLRARLNELAAALPAAVPQAAEWRHRIVALEGDAAAIEDQLAALDEAMLAEVAAGLDDDVRKDLKGRLDRLTGGLRQRLPSAEVGAARARLERRLIRERLGIPLLTLFA